MKRSFKYLAVVATLIAAAAPAIAGNGKQYPATFCRAQGTNSISYDWTGAVSNSSTSAREVICPLVRDEVRTDGTGWASLIVNTINLSTSVWLSCLVEGFYPSDHSFGQINVRYQAPQTDWADMNMGTVGVPNPGYMLIRCTIPGRTGMYPSGIASYRIDE